MLGPIQAWEAKAKRYITVREREREREEACGVAQYIKKKSKRLKILEPGNMMLKEYQTYVMQGPKKNALGGPPKNAQKMR